MSAASSHLHPPPPCSTAELAGPKGGWQLINVPLLRPARLDRCVHPPPI